MTAPTPTTEAPRTKRRLVLTFCIVAVVAAVGGTLAYFRPGPPVPPPLPPAPPPLRAPKLLTTGGHINVWWDVAPPNTLNTAALTGGATNIHPGDYVGADACKDCHGRNYEGWAKHPHRWMNALADDTTVKGDFSGKASLSYRGGTAAFVKEGGEYRMRLTRGDLRRTYRITQTIGSRLFQYYVGRQIEGPEPKDHHFFSRDHVLPFGYWLDQKEWIPIVHVGPELPDAERPDPFQPPEQGRHYAEYAASCNHCHTTFPLGDQLARATNKVGAHVPVSLHWSLVPYLEQTRPSEAATIKAAFGAGPTRSPMADWEAPKYATTLGVSCEACHLGSRAHVESGGKVAPLFFPSSPHLAVDRTGVGHDFGRTHDNVNWACGRCHVGTRPQFAAGMSTWNSVEYSDAMRGACYSQLTCVHCHNPHQPLGPQWTRSPDQDDALCLKCHERLVPAEARVAHTHHPMGSGGARCMNCHMPRLNEGLNEVVRTHMIYSPTRADMIEANHPNACNQCHTDQTIDWALGHLKAWYGRSYNEAKLAANYPQRQRPAALGWLHSDNEAVRLVGADALLRARHRRALPPLLDALDDPYLVNRQFIAKGLQEMLGLRLNDFGYRFYQTAEERRPALERLRAHLAAGPQR